jgi:hypothetical protein
MSSTNRRVKTEAKLEEAQARLDGARARLKGASADVRLDLEKQIAKLDKKLTAARRKARSLSESAEDAWSDLAKSIDDAFDGVAGGIKAFFSKKH